jgi:hypothetical protein
MADDDQQTTHDILKAYEPVVSSIISPVVAKIANQVLDKVYQSKCCDFPAFPHKLHFMKDGSVKQDQVCLKCGKQDQVHFTPDVSGAIFDKLLTKDGMKDLKRLSDEHGKGMFDFIGNLAKSAAKAAGEHLLKKAPGMIGIAADHIINKANGRQNDDKLHHKVLNHLIS